MNKEVSRIEDFHKVVTGILYSYDPVGLMGCNIPKDEYNSEAGAIIRKLHDIKDLRELKWIVYDVFEAYFSKENILPLSHECYRFIAEEIWEKQKKFSNMTNR